MQLKHPNSKKAVINLTTLGDNTLVTAVTGQKIVVLALELVSTGVNVLTFKSSTTTIISGPKALAANGGIVLPYNPAGWFETSVGELLNLNLSATAVVGGSLVYELQH